MILLYKSMDIYTLDTYQSDL